MRKIFYGLFCGEIFMDPNNKLCCYKIKGELTNYNTGDVFENCTLDFVLKDRIEILKEDEIVDIEQTEGKQIKCEI